ncbi:MAG: hypothetical protein EA350_14125 [Gemmatimonadales bacterium]|nr:MAG: hypothetical protein EA350_14125 [Gemmatimonadales bacterium]
MRRSYAKLLLPLLILAAAGCGDRDGPRLASGDLAAAGDLRFTVEEAARMLAPVETLPNDPEVIRALADFWTDYTLLALAIHQEGGLDNLDLTTVTGPQDKQSLVLQLRDEVIDDDVQIPDAELEQIYETERPGEEVRARHILLQFPPDATQAQTDSVRALAADLRQQAVAGANFATLASDWSADGGSAQRGGDLDYFPRGAMVEPFEEAAFATEPGEVSEIVETQYGLHIIRVEDRRNPTFDEIRDDLALSMRQDRVMQAESIFVAGVEEAANVRTEDDAPAIMREVAGQRGRAMSRRAAGRALVRYEGGAFTAADFQEFLATQPPELVGQVDGATDEELRGLLDNLVRSELLVAEARRRGIEPAAEESRLVAEGLREQYRDIARSVGILELERQSGESVNRAIDRRIREILEQVIRNEADVFPLQSLAMPLRAQFGTAISEDGLQRTVERVEALRAEGFQGETPPAAPTTPPASPPATPPSPDTPDTDGDGDAGPDGENP